MSEKKKKSADVPAGSSSSPAGAPQIPQNEAVEENKNQVSERHRQEWRTFRSELLNDVYASHDPDAAKFAKAVADILKVCQEGERKAWGFADDTDTAIDVSWNN